MKSLSEYKKIFGAVKGKLVLGAANVKNPNSQAMVGVYISRLITSHLLPLLESFSPLQKKPQLKIIFRNMLIALIAEIAASGNCEAGTAMGLLKLLKIEDWQRIDLICAFNADDPEDNHTFIVLNLDDQSDYEEPETWKTATLFDVYYDKLIPYGHKDFPETLEQLIGFKKYKMGYTLRLDRHLTRNDWLILRMALEEFKIAMQQTNIAKLVDDDFKKKKSDKTSAALPVRYEFQRDRIVQRIQLEIDEIGIRFWKNRELKEDTQLIRCLKANTHLLFRGLYDDDMQLDAVAELKSQEDLVNALKVSQTLRAGNILSRAGKFYFTLWDINMPASTPQEARLGDQIYKYYGK